SRARCIGLTRTSANLRPCSFVLSSSACLIPLGRSGRSVREVCAPEADHSVSPWRMSQISCFGSLIAAFFRMGFGDCDYVKDLLVMAEKMVANIWPEFLGKIVSGVERNSCSHGHGKVTHGALVVRIISTGDAARSCGCEDFRSIENSPAGISPSHE